MSPIPACARFVTMAIVLAMICGSDLGAADPHIVRASREVPAKPTRNADRDAQETGAHEVAESHKPDRNPDDQDSRDQLRSDNELSYSPQWPEPPNTGAMLMRLFGGTVIVLALCVGTLWFGKPWLQRLQASKPGSTAFQIEGSVVVGNRAMLHLVRVGETQLVVGTDATGLKSLITLPMSFPEVLDQRVAPIDTPVIPSAYPLDIRGLQ